jgi:signal transduction histidine kinase
VCYTWRPGLIRLHVISDALIGLTYFSIPVTLVYIKRKRRDLPFGWMLLLFGLFIVACGATHWMEVWTMWHPQYWLAGVVKAVTAAASVPTAIALSFLIPRALAIPSMRQLQEAKDALEVEVVERRRAEIALREAQATLEERVEERTAALAEAREQAEAANRLKDEFLATVSHELRSPLNSIMGWLHVLDNAPAGAAEARHAIDRIRRNVDAQARLISDLLDLSRIITGKLRLEMRRLDPVALLEDAVQSLRAAAAAKRIDLSLTAEPAGVLVAGDPDRLGQVVWNLLSNALKFTPEGGRSCTSSWPTPERVSIPPSCRMCSSGFARGTPTGGTSPTGAHRGLASAWRSSGISWRCMGAACKRRAAAGGRGRPLRSNSPFPR